MKQDATPSEHVQHARGPGDWPAAGGDRQGGHAGSRGTEGQARQVFLKREKGARSLTFFQVAIVSPFGCAGGGRPKVG